MENYRPISVLSVFSKVFEKVILTEVWKYLKKFNIIHDNQHGFRENHSTETATFNFVQYIHDQLDAGKNVTGLFFDLSRAFDTVDPSFVGSKLCALGIRGNINDLIVSFLETRSFYVVTNGATSESRPVNLGVAQGSSLGPLIFLLYINDLHRYISSGVTINFADDTSILLSSCDGDDLQGRVAAAVDEMREWCCRNKLILNVTKTKVLHFTKNNFRYVEPAETKFLGVFVDGCLSWSGHVNYVVNRLNSAYYAILKLKNSMEPSDLLTVYYALAYPHISYNVVLWGHSLRASARVLTAQERLLRLIFGLKPRDSCRPIYNRYRILTFSSVFIYKCAMFVYDNSKTFVKNGSFHDYSTRGRDNLSVPTHSSATFETSPKYCCLSVYNKLPLKIKQSTNK